MSIAWFLYELCLLTSLLAIVWLSVVTGRHGVLGVGMPPEETSQLGRCLSWILEDRVARLGDQTIR